MRGFVTAGGRLELADLPEPEPGPGELVVDVRAYGLNGGELALLEQRPDGFRPGQDVAGVVEVAAADGSGPPVGTRVVAYPEWHGWAERVAVPAAWTAPLPAEVGYEQAAALPAAGLTALRALRLGGSVLGRDVLVTGATGGVGTLAVQLAVASGAHVVAHVTRAGQAPELLALGADDVVTAVDDTVGPFHLVLDAVGGPLLAEVAARMAPGGTIVLYGNKGGAADVRLRHFYAAGAFNARIVFFVSTVPDETKGEDMAILVELVAAGRVTPQIGWAGDWTRTPEALSALAGRQVRGKAVLSLP